MFTPELLVEVFTMQPANEAGPEQEVVVAVDTCDSVQGAIRRGTESALDHGLAHDSFRVYVRIH